MAGTPGGADLERLLAERGAQLIRVAIALTGDRQSGEDLLQAALERLLRKPHAVESDTEGYLRRILYNLAADGWRRHGRWRQRLPLLRPALGETVADGTATVDLRDALVRLLYQLPPRQRAVIVLRYWEQLSEAETAALLGCSEGTVKSAASRGLRRLRDLAGADVDLTGTQADRARPAAGPAGLTARPAAGPARLTAEPAGLHIEFTEEKS
jgi:RNA polymerase sigma-70 factor (sigma-E family)